MLTDDNLSRIRNRARGAINRVTQHKIIGNDMKMLNIGCGDTANSQWVNIDLGGGDNVTSHDVTKGLPFPDQSFDVVYHSHLLEHLPREKALSFMGECFRILKPGGIVRVLVPDLEQISRLYLEKLARAEEYETEYDWIMLELYDQCVREKSGGLMEQYLIDVAGSLTPFIASRMGGGAAKYTETTKTQFVPAKLTWRNLSRTLYILRIELAKLVVYAITGKKGQRAFAEGLFRHSGEVHRWMYDKFSLGRLMNNAGFAEIRVVSPLESSIPNFGHYNLDAVDGVVRKPDSLVMEGTRP